MNKLLNYTKIQKTLEEIKHKQLEISMYSDEIMEFLYSEPTDSIEDLNDSINLTTDNILLKFPNTSVK